MNKIMYFIGAVTRMILILLLWILLFIVLGAIFVSTASAGDLQLQVAGISKHSNAKADGGRWNENNAGMGVRYSFDDAWSIQGGFYRNSYSKRTTYALVQWKPLRASIFSAGVFGGYASGYPIKAPVIAGLMLDTQVTSQVTLTVRYVPRVSKNTTAVTAFEMGYRF